MVITNHLSNLVIIGHGPSAVGKGYGKLIDSMDCVVRMHSCETQNVIDYGTKYDCGILPGPWLPRAVDAIVRVPAHYWLVYMLHNQKRKKTCPGIIRDRPTIVDELGIQRLLGDMEFPPTRGLCAVALAAAHLRPKKIWLVGFDSLLTGIVTQYHETHPDRMPEEYIGKPKNARHDFELENRKLMMLCETYQIQIKDISAYDG